MKATPLSTARIMRRLGRVAFRRDPDGAYRLTGKGDIAKALGLRWYEHPRHHPVSRNDGCYAGTRRTAGFYRNRKAALAALGQVAR